MASLFEMHMIVLLCMSTFFATKPTHTQQASVDLDEYGIILDGGSSGTKIKVYQWNRLKQTTSGDGYGVLKYNLKQVEGWKFPPGIGTKAYKVHEIHSYLEPIMEMAKHAVPKQKHSTTPIFFLATAGLRILPMNITENLLNAIETSLKNRTLNPFHLAPRDAVRVISGEEEAVYGWVTVNYLKGFFWSNRPPTQSVGVLEMGGGSTQIAFLPDHSVYANMFPVRVNGVTYHLYAHSYLFYGQNYILSRINEYLLALSITENPCMLKGDSATITAFDTSVLMKGSANATKCLEIIDIFLRTADDNWCFPKPCAIGRTYQPSVHGIVFYAISAFTYAPRYLNAVDSLDRLDILQLKTNAQLYCQKTLQEVVSEGLPAAYASPYCTMGLYIPTLLLEAYGFTPEQNIVYIKQEIGDIDIDWALGAMLTIIETANDVDPNDKECETSPLSSRDSTNADAKGIIVTLALVSYVFVNLIFS